MRGHIACYSFFVLVVVGCASRVIGGDSDGKNKGRLGLRFVVQLLNIRMIHFSTMRRAD